MRRTLLARAVAGVLACAGSAAAQEDAVVITATPLRSQLFEFASPADVLAGERLLERRASSLGETLDALPGVSSTYFGPHASRPVLRGLDGERIRILQNGTGTLDASALSFDHAVPYDPLAAERIEVVRGPAAVLYGGSAVGGVVNLVDNRIPATPLTGTTGRFEARAGGPERGRSAGALLETGDGAFALHAGGFARRAANLRTPRGRLANSDARGEGGAIGGAAHWSGGHAGISYQGFDANYGSIPEPAVRIDMRSGRWDFAGAHGGLALKLGRTDYEHREIERGAVNTTFRNKGGDGRLEYAHGRLGPLDGTVGVDFADFDFSALGAEAFVPKTATAARGLFVYEELAVAGWKLSAGMRAERVRVSSEGGGRFDPAQARRFAPRSLALGGVYGLGGQLALALNVARSERAPVYYELYANGPHAATGVFEVGNAAFDRERSRAIDAGLRWKAGKHAASVTLFRTRFDNFITLFRTGNTRGADGELNPVDADGNSVADGSGEEILPELVYRAVPARFHGLEAQGRFRIHERVGTLDLEIKADRVHATDLATGRPLPRISPARLGLGLHYQQGRWVARLDALHAKRQSRVALNEQPTAGYTLVNAFVGYRLPFERAALHAFVRLTNLFDEEARSHVSLIKDRAPLGGRGMVVGLRGSF